MFGRRSSESAAVVRAIDRVLVEEALRTGLYDKPGNHPLTREPEAAAIHPRDLSPEKREALIEEVRKILEGGDAG